MLVKAKGSKNILQSTTEIVPNLIRNSLRRLVSVSLAIVISIVTSAAQSNETTLSASSDQTAERSIDKAIQWIFSSQAEDGGWHSEYYGSLRDGAATTSLTLYALSHCPPDKLKDHRESILRARDFLLKNVNEKGYVTNAEGPDYVTYGSAMLLIADTRLKLDLDQATRNKLRDFLVAAQLTERQNYRPDAIDYGGWDLMGWAQSPRKSAGTNVSVSASALEALAEFDDEKTDACRLRAKSWLVTCRAEDGGYFFHPKKDHDGNKAGWNDGDQTRKKPKSYGTATCDALRCMVALGIDPKAKQFRETVEWIQSKDKIDRVPGFESEQGQLGWRTGLHFYFLHSLSKTLPILSDESRQEYATEISRLLVECQSADGFWQNENARMREDDPLIATGLALVAQCNTLQ